MQVMILSNLSLKEEKEKRRVIFSEISYILWLGKKLCQKISLNPYLKNNLNNMS